MHLVVHFCGTGDQGEDIGNRYNYIHRGHVKVLVVKGCDDPAICGHTRLPTYFPNLKSFANRFVKTLFKAGAKSQLQISPQENQVLASIGINVSESSHLEYMQGNPVESITLCGYSRGAVTCFEVARILKKIAPNIPVDIVANQPVPGNCYQGPGTNAQSIADCSDLTNIKNVSVILGAYTGAATEFDLYVRQALPPKKDLEKYKCSYIFVKDPNKDNNNPLKRALYYVEQDGEIKKIHYGQEQLRGVFNDLGISANVVKKHTLPGSYLAWFTSHYRAEAMRETTSAMHQGFYSQILPKLPRTANQEHIIIPRETHRPGAFRPNSPTGEEHMHMKVASFLQRKNKEAMELVSKANAAAEMKKAEETYTQRPFHEMKKAEDGTFRQSVSEVQIPAALYPPVSQLQRFFGLSKQDAYRYIDKLHPSPHLRKGMVREKDQTLMQWWQAHTKKASATQLTQDLVKAIDQTSLDDPEALKKLFVQVDKWLIAKENSFTFRYAQVEALRNIIYDHLIHQHHVDKEELAALNRQTLSETNYFFKHWIKGSAAASSFKTRVTRKLDEAFAEHAKVSPHTKEADEKLLDALDTWLELREGSGSSRYSLVMEMRQHLQEVIDHAYAPRVSRQPQ